ncbi:hypothetical protein JRQ81_015674 [Phrynocephalus forsythii]|uniref:Uncharacterized protein n=1 Tax=Phrynocephalus forsythii TaxID=171643 RepID=A0A9Q0XV09_9SAUR|nr:hypothetical protein JRQ81_015674 [Phrynocephalus forsythii]
MTDLSKKKLFIHHTEAQRETQQKACRVEGKRKLTMEAAAKGYKGTIFLIRHETIPVNEPYYLGIDAVFFSHERIFHLKYDQLSLETLF